MANQKKTIWVYADWEEMETPQLMGTLFAEQIRGKEIFSFEYEQKWLENPRAQILDPDLQLYRGKQFLSSTGKSNFGLFLDSSPDRWGRVLMRRKEAAMARIERRPERTLSESDYLLGVFDGHRMGSLRYKVDPNGSFLNNDSKLATPPWTSIRELEQISLRLEEEGVSNDPEYLHWLNLLVSPGSSLGGARPKASVLDGDKNLWIAKFPSKQDDSDIGGWEWVVHKLAQKAGIRLPEAKAQRFSSTYTSFLTKRFDRTVSGKRIHFASALTLLGYADGQDYQDGMSYLELAEFISFSGNSVEVELTELWRRIVFSICVSNVDDHLRNHGFLLTPTGWRLSPAYDINPSETCTGLKLNISENDNSLSLDLAMEVIPYFRIKEVKALAILEQVKQAVRQWKTIARETGIPNHQIELKTRAFQVAYQ